MREAPLLGTGIGTTDHMHLCASLSAVVYSSVKNMRHCAHGTARQCPCNKSRPSHCRPHARWRAELATPPLSVLGAMPSALLFHAHDNSCLRLGPSFHTSYQSEGRSRCSQPPPQAGLHLRSACAPLPSQATATFMICCSGCQPLLDSSPAVGVSCHLLRPLLVAHPSSEAPLHASSARRHVPASTLPPPPTLQQPNAHNRAPGTRFARTPFLVAVPRP